MTYSSFTRYHAYAYTYMLIIIIVGAFIVYYPSDHYIYPSTDDHKFIPSEAYPGDIVNIKRDYIVEKHVTVYITRQLQKTDKDGLSIYQLSPVQSIRYPGSYSQKRTFKIPLDINPGKWTMVNTVCYYVYFRKRCYETPRISINILGDKDANS